MGEPRKRDRGPGRGWGSRQTAGLLALVSALVFVDTMFFTAITPLLPHYAASLHLSKGSAGILVAAYPAGTLVGAIPGGIFASRIGVRSSVVTGLCLMSVATLVFGFGHSEALLDAARFVQGLGGACNWAGGLAWLTSGVPGDRRAGALGVAFSAAVGGALLGPAIGALATRVGTGPTFAGATVLGAMLVVGSFFTHVSRTDESQSLRVALAALRDPGLVAGLWLTFLAGLAFGIVDVLSPLRLSRLGASGLVIGAAFIGAAAIEAVLAPPVGRLADRRGRRLPVRIAVALSILVSLLLPTVSPAGVLVVVLILGLPAYGALYVPAAALVSDGARRSSLHQGLGFGVSNLFWAGGQAIAAAGSGAIAEATSDLVPYVLLAGAAALTLAMLAPASRRLLARTWIRPG